MSHPYPPLGMSDNHDDDGQVLTDLLPDSHEPADIRGAVEPVEDPKPVTPIPVTRLLANTVSFVQGGSALATPLLAEDLRRKSCFVSVYSNASPAAAVDYVIVSDDRSKISAGAAGIAIKVHHNQVVEIKGHTGALYVIPNTALTASSSIEVSAWGVTLP